MRRLSFSLLLLLVVMGLALIGSATGDVGAQAGDLGDQDRLEARQVQALLNDWRIGLDLSPLAYSETLEQMAVDQAAYVRGLRQFPSDPHAGRNNEGVRVRAVYPQYHWDTYGNSIFVLVGEITWRGTREDALNFWHTSTIHRETVQNGWYREVGIAALPIERGRHLYVAVLGARPNVLPITADPNNRTVYLSNERYARGATGNWIRSAGLVRLFDGYGRPLAGALGEWQAWSSRIKFPDDLNMDLLGGSISALYSDGTHNTMATTSLAPADIPLPAYADSWVTASTAATPEAAATVVAPTATPRPLAHIRIVYDDRSLTLYNTTTTTANIRSLSFVTDTLTVPFTDLNTGFISGSLSAFPAFNCLQITSSTRQNVPIPLECRHSSVTYFTVARFFWAQSDFRVQRGDEIVGDCKQMDSVCEFDLP